MYKEYLAESWEAEARRLQLNWLPGLPPDYDAVTSFRNFGMDLATDMLANDQLTVESTAGLYTRGGLGTSEWARYFADDPLTAASRQGCQLRRSGRMYSFVHKNVVESLVASAMWDDLVSAAGGDVASLTCKAVRSGEEHHWREAHAAAVEAAGWLSESPCSLNRVSVGAQPAVLAFLEDMLFALPSAVPGNRIGSRSSQPSSTSTSGGGDAVVTFEAMLALLHGVVMVSASANTRAMTPSGSRGALAGMLPPVFNTTGNLRAMGTSGVVGSTAYLWGASNAASVLAQAGVSLHDAQWSGAQLQVGVSRAQARDVQPQLAQTIM